MTNALIVVAHPDDETIFMGGFILRHKDWNWTILSLTRASDTDREPKFRRVCQFYNAKPIIFDLDDKELESVDVNVIKGMVKKAIPNLDYDIIFTHGENGEYGHIRHVETNKAVKQLVENNILKCNKLYFFNYFAGKNIPWPDLVEPKPILSSDLTLNLSTEELKNKKQIIRNMYGYLDEKGFELLACNKIETFKLFNNKGNDSS